MRELDTIDVGGMNLPRTKKFRDVRRNGRAAIVIDDLASVDPWQPRGIEIRGRAEDGHTGVTRNLCSPSRSTLVPRRREASASLVEIQSASPP